MTVSVLAWTADVWGNDCWDCWDATDVTVDVRPSAAVSIRTCVVNDFTVSLSLLTSDLRDVIIPSCNLHWLHFLLKALLLFYALQTIRAHGLNRNALWDVTSATLVSQLLYASPAWWGYFKADERNRLQAVIKKAIRYGYLPRSFSILDELREDSDEKLFFPALHGMQTRSSDENCPSVCLSVCHTRELWQNAAKICPDLYTIRKII